MFLDDGRVFENVVVLDLRALGARSIDLLADFVHLPTPSGTDYGVVYLDDHETIAKQIADMRPNCDVLIVSAHMGTEGTHEVNDFQRETAQWLADQGVDVNRKKN